MSLIQNLNKNNHNIIKPLRKPNKIKSIIYYISSDNEDRVRNVMNESEDEGKFLLYQYENKGHKS
jgi:hypothetical protein